MSSRVVILRHIAAITAFSLFAYLVGPSFLQNQFPMAWGPVRVGFLVINVASFVALFILLVRWKDELQWTAARIAMAICILNGLFLLLLAVGLFLFLFPS